MRSPCRYATRAAALALIGALTVVLSKSMAEQPASAFAPDFLQELSQSKEIYVATVRKDGTRSAAVPIWFALMDDAIWSSTSPSSHKARRVHRGSPMLVSARGTDGPFVKANAEVVKDGALAERLGELYARKYWRAWLGFFRPGRAKLEAGTIVLLKLTASP